jgi:hypothetical protein
LIAATSAVAMSSPVGAGVPSVMIKMKISRSQNGPFAGVVEITLVDGQAKSSWVKVKSITGQNEPAQLEQNFFPKGYAINHFTKNGNKITDEVTSPEGYEFTVKAGKPKLFRVKVKQVEPDVDTCFFPRARDEVGGNTNTTIAVNLIFENCPT